MKYRGYILVSILLMLGCLVTALYAPQIRQYLAATVATATPPLLTATESWTYALQSATGNKDEIDGVSADSAGNIFIGGGFLNKVNFNGAYHLATTGSDIFVSKLYPDGTENWFISIDSGGEDFMWDLVADKNGDVVISGGYGGTLKLGSATYQAYKDGSAFWAKLSGKDGKILWIQTAGVPFTSAQKIDPLATAGGNEISVDSKGNIVAQLTASGATYKIGTSTYLNQGPKDSFIVKLSPLNGKFLWSYQFLGSGAKQLRALGITSTDEIIFGHEYIGDIVDTTTRTTYSSKLGLGTPQGTIGILTTAGKLKWMKPVISTGFANVRGAGGDQEGNAYYTGVLTGASSIGTTSVTGYKNGSTFLAKYSSAGVHQWTRVMGNTETDTAGELIPYGKTGVAITSSNQGPNYNLYDRVGNVVRKNVHTVDSVETRATLTIFNGSGDIVARHSPVYTDASSAGVLTYAGGTCFVYQHSFYGTVKYANGTSYKTTGPNVKIDKDMALVKVCY